MKVVGIRRDPARAPTAPTSIHGMGELAKLLPQADFVALTCPLTPETTNLIDAEALRGDEALGDVSSTSRAARCRRGRR